MLMVPLAITSTGGWIRRLGGHRWQTLHRLIYIIAAAGAIHYYWLVKSDIRLPVLYAAILSKGARPEGRDQAASFGREAGNGRYRDPAI